MFPFSRHVLLSLVGLACLASVTPAFQGDLTAEQKARMQQRTKRQPGGGGGAQKAGPKQRADGPKAKKGGPAKRVDGARPVAASAAKPLPTPESRAELEHLAVVRRVLDEEMRHDESLQEILVLRREAVERGLDHRVESLDIFLDREIQRHREFLAQGRSKVGDDVFERAKADAHSWIEKGEMPGMPGKPAVAPRPGGPAGAAGKKNKKAQRPGGDAQRPGAGTQQRAGAARGSEAQRRGKG